LNTTISSARITKNAVAAMGDRLVDTGIIFSD
jgi:hypothetical protein